MFDSKSSFALVWMNLSSPTTPPSKENIGASLSFKKQLPIIDPAQGAQLLTPNLMRTWINHLSKKDRNLHNLAIQVANDVQAFVKQHPSTGLAFVTELDRGNVPFDRLTKSNTIQSILGSMDADGIKQHLESILADAYEKPSTVEPKLLESRMRRICDQASSLIHNGSVPKRDDWIEMVLHFLRFDAAPNLASQVKVIKSDLTTPETQKICRETLLKTLGDLNAQSLDFQSWTSKIMSDILVWKEDPRVISTFDSVNDKIVMKAMKEAQSLRKKKKLDSRVEKGATLLLDGLILEKLASKEDKDEEIDEALKACTESASQLRKNNDNKSTGELSPHTDVLLDIIIGFMEKATAFGRSLAKLVFLNLTSEMTSDSVDLLIAQLERKTAEELMDVDDEENDQENIDEESDEEESSSESADDGSAEEEMDDEEAAKLRLELERVLKTGTDALDPENSSD
ncbi:hypothetical protein DL96DRAFT_1708785 [Flagelloscypha sp. PMI_526]|nr:hypothetical protein DL96DRAFT_1708785 [Flagelloscypha sp. PMI_526]